MAKKRKLSPKQERFPEEFVVDLNKTEAAKRSGYKESSAHYAGSDAMRVPEIRKRVQELMDARSARTEITADKVLLGLFDIADLDIGDAYDDSGRLLNVKDMPKNVRKAISSIKVYEEYEGFGPDRIKVGEVREVKFHPKIPAYELCGKHLKLFADKLEVSFTNGLAEKIAKGRKRASGDK